MPESTNRYRMPPEWAPHQGTWLSWPHNRATWPGCLSEAEAALAQAVVALAEGETVHINVLDEAHRAAVAARFAKTVAPERLRFHLIRTDDAWCRDHGPIFAFDRTTRWSRWTSVSTPGAKSTGRSMPTTRRPRRWPPRWACARSHRHTCWKEAPST